MTDQEAHEILERNGYAKHSDAITCVQDACDQGFVEGRASRQEEVERLKKALNRAVGSLKEIEAGGGSSEVDEASRALYDIDLFLKGEL